jgi:hypothetical protein
MTEAKGRLKTIAVIAAIWVAASMVISKIVITEPTKVQNAALAYLVFSEILTAAVLCWVESREAHDSLRVGFYVGIGFYFVFSALTALVHLIGLASTSTWLHVGEIALAVMLATALILLGRGAGEVGARDMAALGRAAGLQGVLGRLEAITLSRGLEETDRTILKSLAEDLRFFDKATAPSDAKIAAKIGEIEAVLAAKGKGPSSEDAEEGDAGSGLGGLVDELHALVKLRAQESQGGRRGGF